MGLQILKITVYSQSRKVRAYIYNHFHNILRFFDVLQNFTFTTSETMREYYNDGMYDLPKNLRHIILGN